MFSFQLTKVLKFLILCNFIPIFVKKSISFLSFAVEKHKKTDVFDAGVNKMMYIFEIN